MKWAPYWTLNLARQPFRVTRWKISLWLGVALLAVLFLIVDLALIGYESSHAYRMYRKRRQLEREIDQQMRAIRDLQRAIQRIDTPTFRQECEFLVQQVKARNFNWSEFLQVLEETLPDSVRTLELQPETTRLPRGGTATRIPVRMTLEARSLEDFLHTVSRLYRSGRFSDVQVDREEQDKNQFGIIAMYHVPSLESRTPPPRGEH